MNDELSDISIIEQVTLNSRISCLGLYTRTNTITYCIFHIQLIDVSTRSHQPWLQATKTWLDLYLNTVLHEPVTI